MPGRTTGHIPAAARPLQSVESDGAARVRSSVIQQREPTSIGSGEILDAATPAQLLDKPQHAVTQQLVAASLPDVGIVPVL